MRSDLAFLKQDQIDFFRLEIVTLDKHLFLQCKKCLTVGVQSKV